MSGVLFFCQIIFHWLDLPHRIYPFHLQTLHGPSTLPLCRYFKISLLSIHSRGVDYQMTSEILTSQDSVPKMSQGHVQILRSFIYSASISWALTAHQAPSTLGISALTRETKLFHVRHCSLPVGWGVDTFQWDWGSVTSGSLCPLPCLSCSSDASLPCSFQHTIL